MEPAQESLAGRVAVLQMSSLSQHELYGQGENRQFTIEMGALKDRKKNRVPADMAEIYERIWNGSMPGYRSGRYSDRSVFYSSYLQACIDG